MSGNHPSFPASRIARAAGWSKRRVLAALATIPADGSAVVSGNVAPAWSVESLPLTIRRELEDRARRFGFRSIAAVIEQPVQRWEPEWPLALLQSANIDYARRLQRVLSPLLVGLSDLTLKPAELKQAAQDAFRREFGYSVEVRRIEKLADLVIERDRGFEEWGRVELFLPGRYRLAARRSAPARGGEALSTLNAALATIANPAELSPADRSMVWRAAVQTVLDRTEAGEKGKAVKRDVISHLSAHLPEFSKSEKSLRLLLNSKIDQAREHGISSIEDLRPVRSGRFRKDDFPEDKLLLAKVATRHEQNVSLAHRLLHKGWTDPDSREVLRFSEEYRARYPLNMRRDKSDVPEFMRTEVRPVVAAVRPHVIGANAVRLSRPSRFRDPGSIAPNEWHQLDDETSNSFVYWPDTGGRFECEWGRFECGRVQVFPLIDVATGMPLGLEISMTPGYSADTLRDLIIAVWRDPGTGMPSRGLYLEGGTHQSNPVRDLVRWTSDDDAAFARQGIKLSLRHARTPKAKIIENAFGIEQARTSAFPGYIGRGAGDSRHERVDRFLQSLRKPGQPRKANVDPREMLWSAAEYADAMFEVLRELSEEPQNGARLRGQSPAEAWAAAVEGGMVAKVLPPELEYQLATRQIQKKVSRDGIVLKVGNDRLQYLAHPLLGRLIGETVNVRFSGRYPDHVVVVDPVRDPKGLSPFVVPFREKLPAMDATRADFQRAKAEEDVFLSAQRSIIKLLRPKHHATISRADYGTEDMRAAGAAHAAAVEGFEEQKRKRKAAARKAHQLAREHRVDIRGVDEHKAVVHLERWEELARAAKAEQNGNVPTNRE